MSMTIDDILDHHASDLELLAAPHPGGISYIATVDGRPVHVFVNFVADSDGVSAVSAPYRHREADMHPSPTDLFGGTSRRFAGAGYAASPGTGPAGQTCGTCAHCRRQIDGWHKCALVLETASKKTDISRRAPACLAWQDSSES